MDTTGSELIFSDSYWSDEMQAPITHGMQLCERSDVSIIYDKMEAPQGGTTMLYQNDFVRDASVSPVASLVPENANSLQTYQSNLSKVTPFVAVHRREMQRGLPMYHSIRTNTSSVFVVGFIGTLEQAVDIGNRLILVVFDDREFKERLKFLCPNELLVLIRIVNAHENATFRFAYGAEETRPQFHEYKSQQGLGSRWGVVWKVPLIAIQTSLRNVGGKRDIRVEARTASFGRDGAVQYTRAETEVKLDVQLSITKKKKRGMKKRRPNLPNAIRRCKKPNLNKKQHLDGSKGIAHVNAREENDEDGGIPSRYVDDYFHGHTYPEANEYNLVRKFRNKSATDPISEECVSSNGVR